MKRFFLLLIMAGAMSASAQVYHYYNANVAPWRGPVRVTLGGGMATNMGQATFPSNSSSNDFRTPLSFSNSTFPMFSLAADMRTGNSYAAFTAFFGVEYYPDGWSATLQNTSPEWVEQYDMISKNYGGHFGFGVTSYFTENLHAALGVGLFVHGTGSCDYTSTAASTRTGERIENWQPRFFMDGKQDDLSVGLLGKLDVVYNVNDWLSVGLQGRYDLMSFYSVSSDDAFPHYVNDFQKVGNGDRHRFALLLNVGFTFLSGEPGGGLR